MFILVCKSSFFIFDCFLLLCYGLLSGLLLSLNNNDNNNNNNNNNDDDDDDNNNNNNNNNINNNKRAAISLSKMCRSKIFVG